MAGEVLLNTTLSDKTKKSLLKAMKQNPSIFIEEEK